MLLALGIVLPIFTMQIKEIGDTLLPMHLPIMLCGIICGWQYGAVTGLLLPFIRSLIFTMPPIYPNAVWMALELCAYGFTIGFVYSLFKKRDIVATYISLLSSMLVGRIVWGISKFILLGLKNRPFTFWAFFSGAFVDSLLGIIIQLILVPSVVLAWERLGDIKKEN